MKYSIALIALFFAFMPLYGQDISQSTISTAGGSTTNKSGLSMSWTIGEVFGQTAEKGCYVTEGFQQGLLFKTVDPKVAEERSQKRSRSAKKKVEQQKVNVYPTLVKNELKFNFSSSNQAPTMVRIISTNGQIIDLTNQISFVGFEFEINDINSLPPGTYFLQLLQNDQLFASEKFIKL